ncbi:MULTISPECIES: glutamate racemase [Campylobacter]|uniref:glutamate racemase n=1 Tax=Campylobacter TaxID=194 RepID=UPI0014707814|nr:MULTISPECIES: glutamate racemase [Campylobacter]MDU6827281.1 glutamate racemase [Campylobacter sp.]
MKIGIFDSGLGGLSVLNEALKKLPNEEFLYYADRKNVPYGLKSKDEILKFSSHAVKFLIDQGANAIVIACNTATSAAINELRAKFDLPIIGMEPAVKKAADLNREGENLASLRTLVIATPLTARGAKLKELIERVDSEHLVDVLALPRLVEFAENENFTCDEVKEYLHEEFAKFKLQNYYALVLGCTHFNYFKDSLREILPTGVSLIDGNEGTINKLISELSRLNLAHGKGQSVEYFYSDAKIYDNGELARIGRYLARLDKMLEIK